MIEHVVPRWMASVDRSADVSESTLFPEELVVISRAVPRRRAEFTTARHCARTALRSLGVPLMPILPGPGGAPSWPEGVVGSMTHCDGFRAAVVTHRGAAASVGIDAEPRRALPDSVLNVVARPEELLEVARCCRIEPVVPWDRLLFSAKESVYKAWYPLTHRWLDFGEASIRFDTEARTYTADLLVPGPRVGGRNVATFAGRFAVISGLVLSAVVVPPC